MVDPFSLSANVLKVWRVSISSQTQLHNRIQSILSAEEIRRSAMLKLAHHRRLWQASRSAMRLILASYCETNPRNLAFSVNKFGKPRLLPPNDWLDFNTSHSEDYMVIGLTRGSPVGLDVQWAGGKADTEKLSKAFFSPLEHQWLSELPARQRREAFYCTWTRKEAFTKAIGLGLSLPMSNYSVTVDPCITPRIVSVQDNSVVPDEWMLRDIPMPEGYRASAAVYGNCTCILADDWTDPG